MADSKLGTAQISINICIELPNCNLPQKEGDDYGDSINNEPAFNIKDAWVQLWDDKGFKDRRLDIAHPTDYPNFGNVTAGGQRGFNDKASSVKWKIPRGWKGVLYDDKNYKDSRFELVGTGRVEENADLGSFSDKASSFRWEETRA